MGLLTCTTDSAPLPTLIALAKLDERNDTEAMNAILRRYEPMTKKIARGLTAANRDLYDDVANACRLGLVRAVRRHDLNRIGFTAYAQRFMRGAGLRELREWSASFTLQMLEDETVEAPENVEEAVADKLAPWGGGALARSVSSLSAEQELIATLRYRDDAPLASIASVCGTSVPAVSQRLATIHRRLELELAA